MTRAFTLPRWPRARRARRAVGTAMVRTTSSGSPIRGPRSTSSPSLKPVGVATRSVPVPAAFTGGRWSRRGSWGLLPASTVTAGATASGALPQRTRLPTGPTFPGPAADATRGPRKTTARVRTDSFWRVATPRSPFAPTATPHTTSLTLPRDPGREPRSSVESVTRRRSGAIARPTTARLSGSGTPRWRPVTTVTGTTPSCRRPIRARRWPRRTG